VNRVGRQHRSGVQSRFARPRVLVVDDCEDNRELCAAVLDRHGYEVWTARDGEEAVEKAIELRPHVVIMDIAMPMMDGWEATRRIRALPETASTYVLVLSAFGDASSRQQSKASGCDEHVVKPIDPDELLTRIAAAFQHLREVG
jgi:two-component system, cell cycle response regulator DivK